MTNMMLKSWSIFIWIFLPFHAPVSLSPPKLAVMSRKMCRRWEARKRNMILIYRKWICMLRRTKHYPKIKWTRRLLWKSWYDVNNGILWWGIRGRLHKTYNEWAILIDSYPHTFIRWVGIVEKRNIVGTITTKIRSAKVEMVNTDNFILVKKL